MGEGDLLQTRLGIPFPEAEVLGLDIETTGLDIWNDKVTAIAISDGRDSVVYDIRQITSASLANWIVNSVYNRKIIVHHGMFDLSFLNQQFNVQYPVSVFDTEIAESLLTAGLYEDDDDDEVFDLGRKKKKRVPCTLEAVAERRLGLKLDKSDELRLAFRLDNEWSEEQIRYAETDAKILIPLWMFLGEEIIKEGMDSVCRIEMRCLPVFCEMYRKGITVDVEKMSPLIEEARKTVETEKEKLQQLLTFHIWKVRKQQNEASEKEFLEWVEDYTAVKEGWEQYWEDKAAILFPDEIVSVWREWWLGRQPESSKREVTEKEIQSWLDTKVTKGKTEPAGKTRFVKRLMQFWKDNNPKPVIQPLSLVEPLNVNSQPQKMAAITDYLALYSKSKNTKVSPPPDLRGKTIVAYAAEAPDEIRENLYRPHLRWGKAAKFLSSFGDPLPEFLHPDSTVHGGWFPTGCASGRPSCAKPNLLNQPKNKQFRGCFTARAGYVLVVSDYSQMELRLLAELSRDSVMLDAFRNGEDLHLITAVKMYQKPSDLIVEDERKTAKIVNFGIGYGMGPKALHYQLAGWEVFVSREEARHYWDTWNRTFSGARDWLTKTGKASLSRGYSVTPLGRRRHFGDPSDISRLGKFDQMGIEREGANHPIQGANADITKLAMILMQPDLESLGGSVIMQVYDEIIAEVPEDKGGKGKEIVEAAMISAASTVMKVVTPIVDAKVSKTWG